MEKKYLIGATSGGQRYETFEKAQDNLKRLAARTNAYGPDVTYGIYELTHIAKAPVPEIEVTKV